MPSYQTMTTCTHTFASPAPTETHEEPTVGASSGSSFDGVGAARARKRRRHSSYDPRSWSVERENAQEMVDNFLADLGKRLEMLETYGHLKFDAGVKSIHETLQAVHERCSTIGGEVVDAGRRRRKVFVDTLDAHYRDVMSKVSGILFG